MVAVEAGQRLSIRSPHRLALFRRGPAFHAFDAQVGSVFKQSSKLGTREASVLKGEIRGSCK